MQRRNDESPDLPHDHGQGEDDAAISRNRQPCGEPLERAEVLQTGGAELGALAFAEADIRLGEKSQYRTVGSEHDDDPDHDGQQRADDARSQLGKVLGERHVIVGRCHLRARISFQRQLHSEAVSSTASTTFGCCGAAE